MGTEISYYLGVKQPGRDADDSSLSSAEVKNACGTIRSLPDVFVACNIVRAQDTYSCLGAWLSTGYVFVV